MISGTRVLWPITSKYDEMLVKDITILDGGIFI
jgi:hypothetical protein